MLGFGKICIAAGAILIAVGVFWMAGERFLSLGRLPGDLVVKKGNFTLYFPLATSLLLSMGISLLLFFLNKRTP